MMKHKHRLAAALIALVLTLGLLVGTMPAALATEPDEEPEAATQAAAFTVVNPYEAVDWASFGQYKAALHVHTTHSDGSATPAETVRRHYHLGFDILAITDHNALLNRWDERPQYGFNWFRRLHNFFRGQVLLTTEEKAAIYAGAYPSDTRQQLNGMISLPAINEQSRAEHVNTFWAPFNNSYRDNIESVLQRTTELGGIAILNHPGRYTGGRYANEYGEAASNDPAVIQRYVNWFGMFDVALGMEIFNRLDRETASERILWDNVLMALMPYGRPVWGFSNDDSHSVNCVGYNWNVMLMPELTAEATRTAMETGAFYAVTRVARREGVNADQPSRGSYDTLFLLNQPTPGIDNIEVAGDTITITGRDYDTIEWIADGRVIHTGATLDLAERAGSIGHSYVRAQLLSETGAAMTQPFGIWWGAGIYPETLVMEVVIPDPPALWPLLIPVPGTGMSLWQVSLIVLLILTAVVTLAAILKRRKRKVI